MRNSALAGVAVVIALFNAGCVSVNNFMGTSSQTAAPNRTPNELPFSAPVKQATSEVPASGKIAVWIGSTDDQIAVADSFVFGNGKRCTVGKVHVWNRTSIPPVRAVHVESLSFPGWTFYGEIPREMTGNLQVPVFPIRAS